MADTFSVSAILVPSIFTQFLRYLYASFTLATRILRYNANNLANHNNLSARINRNSWALLYPIVYHQASTEADDRVAAMQREEEHDSRSTYHW